MAFKPAKCPNCGGSLQVPDDREFVNCMYCSTSIVVREALRVTIKSDIENLFRLADTARDAGNFQEAYAYYTQILEEDGTNSRAWFGKGLTAAGQSNDQVFKIPEMIASLEKAVEFASHEEKAGYIQRAGEAINSISITFYSVLRGQVDNYVGFDDSWNVYLHTCSELISALQVAHNYSPSERIILRSASRVVHFRQVLGSREMKQDEDRMRHEVPPTERMVAEIRSPTRGVDGARRFSKKVT